MYFKFLERDGNRGPWPASVILIGLDNRTTSIIRKVIYMFIVVFNIVCILMTEIQHNVAELKLEI